MKIISKYKDYYDYLQGIRGIDSKVVLDRSESTYNKRYTMMSIHELNVLHIHICGLAYDGVYCSKKKRTFWGEQLSEVASEITTYQGWDGVKNKMMDNPAPVAYIQPDKNYKERKMVFIEPRPSNLNELTKCPIVEGYNLRNYTLYPHLKDFDFGSVLTPEEIWDQLYNWIVKMNEPSVQDNRTDEEKIKSNGFDTKTSFRNM